MSGSGREVLPEVWEYSEGPPGSPGVVERSSWKSGSSRKILLEVREWLGVPPG